MGQTIIVGLPALKRLGTAAMPCGLIPLLSSNVIRVATGDHGEVEILDLEEEKQKRDIQSMVRQAVEHVEGCATSFRPVADHLL